MTKSVILGDPMIRLKRMEIISNDKQKEELHAQNKKQTRPEKQKIISFIVALKICEGADLVKLVADIVNQNRLVRKKEVME